MRGKCAVTLWIWALCILFWSAKHLDPVFGWKEWAMVLFQFGKCAILAYCGFNLIDADQEINNLKYSNRQLEGIIGEIQGSHGAAAQGTEA